MPRRQYDPRRYEQRAQARSQEANSLKLLVCPACFSLLILDMDDRRADNRQVRCSADCDGFTEAAGRLAHEGGQFETWGQTVYRCISPPSEQREPPW